MRRLTFLAASLCMLLGLVAIGCDDENANLEGREPFAVTDMNGQNEVPPNASTARGAATLDLENGVVSYKIDLHGITGVTAAHVHLGAAGVNGPVVVTLFSGPTTGTVDGTLVESSFRAADIIGGTTFEVLVDQMRNNGAYVNVHTTAFPDGEIRGQMTTVP